MLMPVHRQAVTRWAKSYAKILLMRIRTLFLLFPLLYSCSNSLDAKYENELPRFEIAASEVLNQFNSIVNDSISDPAFNGIVTICSSKVKSPNNLSDNPSLQFQEVTRLCNNKLVEYIFINTDSS